jgi:PKD repeat protein
MKSKKILLVTALLALVLLIGGVSAADYVNFTFDNVVVNNGGTATMKIYMEHHSPANGTSGYDINLVISDPLKAQFTGLSYNSTLGGTTPTMPTFPVTDLRVAWADSGHVIEPGQEVDTYVATVTVQGLSAGSTPVTVVWNDLTGDPPGYELMTDILTYNDPTITVTAPPVANFAADTVTPAIGQTVTFADQSSGSPTTYNLSFGDGTPNATGPGPWTHAYSTSGYKTVSLTVTNDYGFDTKTVADYINVQAGTADFTATPVIGLAPLSVTFTDASSGSPTGWVWQYRASGTSDAWATFATGTATPTYSFPAGAYDIKLTATNSGGDYSVTKTQFLSVSAGPKRLTTVQTGTVSGDLYVGAFQTIPWSSQYSYAGTTFEQTFALPTFTNVQWARLYTEIYASGTDNRYGNATVSFAGDGSTYSTLGDETLATAATSAADVYPVNNHIDRQYSDYRLWYDVTGLITSQNPKAKVVTANSTTNFDGRIKTVVLVVAYNDGGTDTVQYWVNDGHDYQASSGTGITTTFGSSATPATIVSASMHNVALSSRDAVYNFTTSTTNPIANTPGTSNPSFETNVWDVTSYMTAGTDSSLEYVPNGGSYKTILATLTAEHVTPPDAEFTRIPTGVVALGQTVTFMDASANNPTSWDINFGDGSANVTGPGPWTHAYTTADTFHVSLIASNAGGSDTVIHDLVVSSQPIISFVPVSQTVNASESRTYEIQMDNAPNGLAGYDLYVNLAIPAVADITGVSYPAWAQMTMSPTVPADTIHIGAVDNGQLIYPGSTGPFTLAIITVRGSAAGTSDIVLSGLQMDDDYGGEITATLNTGEIIVSSSTAPVAAFHGTPTSGPAPLAVTFTDDSTSGYGAITDWHWDFGNGATFDGQTPPVQTYPVGIYTVKLTVTAPGGTTTETKTNYIVSGDAAPVANFTGSPTSGYYPMIVHFSDASAGNVSTYYWSFGDGTYSGLKDPVHTYTWPGTFTVSLNVTGPGGSDTKTVVDMINTNIQTPTADFSADPVSGLNPLHVYFHDQSTGNLTGITYDWNFGDGSANSTATNPDHTYTANGDYTVTLWIDTDNGADTETKTAFIHVGGNMAVTFTGAPTSGVASRKVPLYVQFTDATAGSPDHWTWNFGNGNTTYNDVQHPVTTYWGRPAKYTVTLTASSPTDSGAFTRNEYITITPYLEHFPIYDASHTITGYMTNLPADLDGDYVYEDINGNGRVDYNDVVTFYNALLGPDYWVQNVTLADFENFDYSGNGAIDYTDIVALNDQVIYT